MNLQKKKPNFIDLHQDIAQTPQDHISIGLSGPYNVASQDNSYTLTAICNLTGLTHDQPYQRQKDNNSSKPYILDIMLKFSFPRILHPISDMEFKS